MSTQCSCNGALSPSEPKHESMIATLSGVYSDRWYHLCPHAARHVLCEVQIEVVLYCFRFLCIVVSG